jgi:hypothetical protein
MAYAAESAVEIDQKLREDFRRRLKESGAPSEGFDPLLAVLFRTFAQQFETFYSDVGRIRVSLLDELIAGLGLERRAARPAQTVVRFLSSSGPIFIEAGTEMIGQADTGDRLTFRTDAGVSISTARIAFGVAYEQGYMQLLGGIDLPDSLQATRPSLDPVSASLGPQPGIYLALENLPAEHLSQHAVFFEVSRDGVSLEQALTTEPWCFVGFDGLLSGAGVMRPTPSNGGVRALRWLDSKAREETSGEEPSRTAIGPGCSSTGFYGRRTFVLPSIPPERRFACKIPQRMEGPLQQIFGKNTTVFQEPRAWLRIGLPEGMRNIRRLLGSVLLHAITASNVECANQTVYFDQQGRSVPASCEAGTSGYLVAPAAIFGESGSPYLPEMLESSPGPNVGRYSILNGRIELRPPISVTGQPERYANLRLWVTRGKLGNRVGPGQIQSFAAQGVRADVHLLQTTWAAGGENGETYEEARARFYQALLSRDRIVTREDLTTAAHAFDRRLGKIRVNTRLERTSSGLQRTHHLTIGMSRDDFADPAAESPVLQDELTRFLKARMLYDEALSINWEWN